MRVSERSISFDRGIKLMAAGLLIALVSVTIANASSIHAIIPIIMFIAGYVMMAVPVYMKVDKWFD
jgi:hypothetical protein